MNKISATQYRLFQTCPLQYKYKYKYHLISKKSDALSIGSLYHEMLEFYHKTGTEAHARQIIKDNPEHSEILTHLLAKYLENPVPGNVIETEFEFTVDIPNSDHKLYGFIDRIDEDKGVEYKTSSKKWNEKDVDNIQTDIYMYVLYKKFGRPFPLVYSVNNKKTKLPPQIIEIKKTEKEILEVEKKMVEYIKKLEETDFPPNPGSHCYMCPWGPKGDGTCEYG